LQSQQLVFEQWSVEMQAEFPLLILTIFTEGKPFVASLGKHSNASNQPKKLTQKSGCCDN
jgi:hypothetical protein